jgi:hypothetical protein
VWFLKRKKEELRFDPSKEELFVVSRAPISCLLVRNHYSLFRVLLVCVSSSIEFTI